MPHAHDPPPDWIIDWRREIGARIRDRRQQLGLSQEQLAGLIYVERRTVYRLEAGMTSPPLDRLLHIARALEVLPADLMPGALGPCPPAPGDADGQGP